MALNDEIIALARAGVPLDRGLLAIGKDMPGRLGNIAQSLGRRLESGEDLAVAIGQSGNTFPPIYRAVVLAGLRSGRLPVALEGIAKTSRRVSDTRRMMLVALIYPAFVLVVATILFRFTMTKTVPTIQATFVDLEIVLPRWYTVMTQGADLLLLALPWIEIATVVLVLIFVYRVTTASVLETSASGRTSTLGEILRAGRLATFEETVELLLEQDLPLAEALELACQASGDRGLNKVGADLADGIRRGEPVSGFPAGFPPLLGWLLMGGGQPGQLVTALRRLAANYRRRATRLATWLAIYLPILLSVGVCGFGVFAYVLLAMVPYY